ncbi:N-acetyltransferase domain-containing protein [Candidatus Magnetomoraceae bacterium gMMP-15]
MNTIDNDKLKKNNKLIKNIINDHVVLKIDIIDNKKQKIGYLCPITKKSLKDDKIIQKLTDWRNFHRKSFLTQFEATYDRTKNWLKDIVLKDKSRLLFLMYSKTKLVGQYGFKGLSDKSVEIDNIIRGETGGHPELVHYAEIALLKWIYVTFNIHKIYAYVLSDNFIVINLHERIGFKKLNLLPLYKIECNNEIRLEIGASGYTSPCSLYVQRLKLIYSDFIRINKIIR